MTKRAILVVVFGLCILWFMESIVGVAQVVPPGGRSGAPTAPPGRMPPNVRSARDLKSVPDVWMWHMGMLRGLYEIDGVATLEIAKSSGTVLVGNESCTLVNY